MSQLATVSSNEVDEELTRFVCDHMAKYLDPRLVWDTEVFVTPAVQHICVLGGSNARELGGEASLSHAGLAADQHHAAFAEACVLPRVHQRFELWTPTDKELAGGIAKHARDREDDPGGAFERLSPESCGLDQTRSRDTRDLFRPG